MHVPLSPGTYYCAASYSLGVVVGLQANSFATTVGSKALTIGQVVLVAAICEFGGAALLGANVTSTIKSGIVRLSYYTDTPGTRLALCVGLRTSPVGPYAVYYCLAF